MSKRRDFSVLRNDLHHFASYISPTVIGAAAFLLIGAGVIFALPERPGDQPPQISAAANVPETTPDESLCAKQAWPYIDQRCAQNVEAARGSRPVRIVTDKGTSVNVVTPVPIVEAKPKRTPAAPIVAQVDRQIGPPVVPMAEEPAPQAERIVVAPQPQPVPAPQAAPEPAAKVATAAAPAIPPSDTPNAADAMAMEVPARANRRSASLDPPQASADPVMPGVEAFDEPPARISKARQRAEKREAKRQARREAKRQRALEREMRRGGVPEEVVAAVKAIPEGRNRRPSEERGIRRARNAVPDEVIAAVEEATSGRGRRGGRVVTIGSPNGGQRIYLVPREW